MGWPKFHDRLLVIREQPKCPNALKNNRKRQIWIILTERKRSSRMRDADPAFPKGRPDASGESFGYRPGSQQGKQ